MNYCSQRYAGSYLYTSPLKIAVGLDMTVSELLDFPEMNETAFDDE